MNKFKIGDKVKCTANCGTASYVREGYMGVVTSLSPCGHYVRVDGHMSGGYTESYELVEAEPTYPNPPHKHAELIKAWADGAEIQCKILGTEGWANIDLPAWSEGLAYRIKPNKSYKDIQIEKLEQQAQQLAKDIAKLKVG